MDEERDYIQILLKHESAKVKFIYRDYFDEYDPDEMVAVCIGDLVDLFLSIGYDEKFIASLLEGFAQGMKDEIDEDNDNSILMN